MRETAEVDVDSEVRALELAIAERAKDLMSVQLAGMNEHMSLLHKTRLIKGALLRDLEISYEAWQLLDVMAREHAADLQKVLEPMRPRQSKRNLRRLYLLRALNEFDAYIDDSGRDATIETSDGRYQAVSVEPEDFQWMVKRHLINLGWNNAGYDWGWYLTDKGRRVITEGEAC